MAKEINLADISVGFEGPELELESQIEKSIETSEEKPLKKEEVKKEEVEAEIKKPVDKTSKEEESEEKEEEEVISEESVIAKIQQLTGYKLEKEFEDTEEGLADYAVELGNVIADEKLNKFFEEHPVAGEFFDYLAMGGDPEKYWSTKTPTLDYNNVDISKEDVQKSVLKTYFRELEYDEDEIKAKLEKYEDNLMLEDEAKTALKKLQVMQKKHQDALIESQKREVEKRQKDVQLYWNNMNKLVDSGNIKGFQVNQKDAEALKVYMQKPVKDGKSQAQLDNEAMTMEDVALLQFLKMKDFKLDSYIKNVAATEKAKSLKDKLSKGSEKLKNANGRFNTAGDDRISFDDMDN